MAVTAATSYIGAVVSVSASTPSTFDSAGYAALSWTPVPDMISWPATGDDHDRPSYVSLAGRKVYVNGAADGGDREFKMRYEKTDAGQIILRNNNGGTSPISVRIVDVDGVIEYQYGLVGSIQQMTREDGTIKGQTGMFACNKALVVV